MPAMAPFEGAPLELPGVAVLVGDTDVDAAASASLVVACDVVVEVVRIKGM